MSIQANTDYEIDELLLTLENEHVEFKEAREKFSFDNLAKYCCALANEGGGALVLGISDKRPRSVVGTKAFLQIEQTRRTLMEKIPLRIEAREKYPSEGRVVIFHIPSRPIGMPLQYEGKYWAREGDSLVSMSGNRLRSIFSESGHDFSSDICAGAGFSDLDHEAIEDFRKRWIVKSGNHALEALSHAQLLADSELTVDNSITYAALILFGSRKALGRFLAQSEIVFEFRSSEATGPAQQRKEYRQGFFSFYEDLWQTINLRNDKQHYQSGLFVLEIPSFAERSVREAILNAVSHRDYQLGGNVFVRQYPRRLEIDSPGGFPVGITIENLLDHQSPRNRRIAEAFAKCGLVERSGQGMNLMFEESIMQGKALPDFTGTDAYHVRLNLHGEIRDPSFVQFLEKIGKEKQKLFTTNDFIVLDLVHREEKVPANLYPRLKKMMDLGVVESFGRGRGVKYLLSKRYYAGVGSHGTYTRRKGLDREEYKALLLQHLRQCGKKGCQMGQLQQVLPSRSKEQIRTLLKQLKIQGYVRMEGEFRGSRWIVEDRAPGNDA